MDFSALHGHQDMLTPGTPEIARLRADAVPLLTQLDAREGLRTQKVVPLPAGMWNALYLLEPAGLVVKLSAGENSFEADFLRAAAALNLPVPQVFGEGRLDHPALPTVTYFLMSYMTGAANGWVLAHTEKAMSPAALAQLGHDLGHALATLHRVRLGYLTRFGVRVASWQQTLTDGFSPDWEAIAPNTLFDAALLPILVRVLKETSYFAFVDGTLVHGDLVLSNVLVDTETHRLRAIIDPAGCAGMPMFDLAYAAMPWDHGWQFHEAMLEGYRQSGGVIDPALFFTSMLIVAYRHERFHTPAVRNDIFERILPQLGVL